MITQTSQYEIAFYNRSQKHECVDNFRQNYSIFKFSGTFFNLYLLLTSSIKLTHRKCILIHKRIYTVCKNTAQDNILILHICITGINAIC